MFALLNCAFGVKIGRLFCESGRLKYMRRGKWSAEKFKNRRKMLAEALWSRLNLRFVGI
jgi:hypothetical protein